MMNKSMQFRDGNFCEFSANWQVVSDDRLIKCKKKTAAVLISWMGYSSAEIKFQWENEHKYIIIMEHRIHHNIEHMRHP